LFRKNLRRWSRLARCTFGCLRNWIAFCTWSSRNAPPPPPLPPPPPSLRAGATTPGGLSPSEIPAPSRGSCSMFGGLGSGFWGVRSGGCPASSVCPKLLTYTSRKSYSSAGVSAGGPCAVAPWEAAGGGGLVATILTRIPLLLSLPPNQTEMGVFSSRASLPQDRDHHAPYLRGMDQQPSAMIQPPHPAVP